MLKDVLREVTPLNNNDCFNFFSRKKEFFNFPLHSHSEMELNLILNGSGARRIVGDHIGETGDLELVLVGPDLPHGWFNHSCQSRDIQEVTIQFDPGLFGEGLLMKNQLAQIRQLFEQAKRGLLFSAETVERLAPQILELGKAHTFESILQLFRILHELAQAPDRQTLSDVSFIKEQDTYKSRRLERVFEYMNRNFTRDISLEEVAALVNMPDTSFSRFVRSKTGYTFTENLIEIRLGHVTRMLVDTTQSVAEIAYKCGFNNLANFNRIFKQRKGCTPKEFRKSYVG